MPLVLSLAPRCVTAAAAVAIALDAGTAGAEVRTHRVEVDPTGHVLVSDLVGVFLAECGSAVKVPAGAVDGALRVGGIRGAAVVLGLDLLLGPLGVHARLDGDHLDVSIDDEVLGRHVDELESALRSLFGAPGPVHALERVPGGASGGPPVVLVHGLDSGPERFLGAARALARDGYDVHLYRYPDDGRIETAARELGRLVRDLQRSTGRDVSLVTVSMGGLVARTYLETDPDFRGEVDRFIAACPPFQGSPMARYHLVREVVETVEDVVGKGFDGFFVFDGLGQAATDLLPGSGFLARLDGAGRRSGVRYSILAGNGSLVPEAGFVAAETVLDGLSAGAGPGRRLALDLLREVVATARQVSLGQGDGAVALTSQRLPGVVDRVVLPHHHLEFLAGDGVSGPIPALAEVRRRLPTP